MFISIDLPFWTFSDEKEEDNIPRSSAATDASTRTNPFVVDALLAPSNLTALMAASCPTLLKSIFFRNLLLSYPQPIWASSACSAASITWAVTDVAL